MSDEKVNLDRPRRSTRPPIKVPGTIVHQDRPKRKPINDEEQVDATHSTHKKPKLDQLQILLCDPKSALTTMDISDILNANTWDMLSPEARVRLVTLLPPTAFRDCQLSVEPTHPSQSNTTVSHPMVTDNRNEFQCADAIDTSIFTDSHFLAAAHTFQDQLYTGWMTDRHLEKLTKFEIGVLGGSLRAPWKDEVWEKDNRLGTGGRTIVQGPAGPQNESGALAGEAAELKLVDLVQGALIKVGDVFAYKRNFSQLNLVIEKDVLIDSINRHTHAITVLIQPGVSQFPQPLLSRNPPEPTPPTQSMTINSPSQLENGVLDVDGRVERSRRPNGNAWKCFTVWRWPDGSDELDTSVTDKDKGGRESHGTLFYLRGNYYHDR